MGLTTDGAPATCSQKIGLVGRIQVKMREEGTGELTVYHCHTPGRALWQSSANGTRDKIYKMRSQLRKSQRFESPAVQVFSGGVGLGIQRYARSHSGEKGKQRKSTEKMLLGT